MLEFVIVLGMSIFVGMVYLVSVHGMLKDVSEQQRAMEIDSFGYSLQDEIILASSVGDGYSRTIPLPKHAGRFDYVLVVENTTPSEGVGIRLSSNDYIRTYDLPSFYCELPSETISCDVTAAFNKNNLTIKNIHGVVILS
jgi:hypothetical protein